MVTKLLMVTGETEKVANTYSYSTQYITLQCQQTSHFPVFSPDSFLLSSALSPLGFSQLGEYETKLTSPLGLRIGTLRPYPAPMSLNNPPAYGQPQPCPPSFHVARPDGVFKEM